MKRRQFLKTSSASALTLGFSPLLRFAHSPDSKKERRLILVELTGGNDALNMVTPRHSKSLRLLRPTLLRSEDQLIPISEKYALHPNLAGMLPIFKSGQMSIINNVGYLPTNRSHFRSLDIWHSGITDKVETQRGWVGRALKEQQKVDKKLDVSLFHLADGPLPLCFGGSPFPITTLKTLDDLRFGGGSEVQEIIRKASEGEKRKGSDADFLKKTTRSALEAAKKIGATSRKTPDGFSKDHFGRQMGLVASLAQAFRGNQIFFTHLTGFDTHAVQNESQPVLLASLSRGLVALQKFLGNLGFGESTILVYSEFGRRVKENASRGTDHGAAGTALLLGDQVRGGLFGGDIDLGNLLAGDLRPNVDFRTVYQDVLSGVLGRESKSLKPDFGQMLRLIRPK